MSRKHKSDVSDLSDADDEQKSKKRKHKSKKEHSKKYKRSRDRDRSNERQSRKKSKRDEANNDESMRRRSESPMRRRHHSNSSRHRTRSPTPSVFTLDASSSSSRVSKYRAERALNRENIMSADTLDAGETEIETLRLSEKARLLPDGKGLPDIGEEIRYVPKQIIIRGLPIEMTNDDLWDYFRPFGPIAYVKVTYDHVTGTSRRFAFVEFEKDITVDQVLAKAEHIIKGSAVDVFRALRPADVKLFLSDMPPYIKNKDITEYFRFGKMLFVNAYIDAVNSALCAT